MLESTADVLRRLGDDVRDCGLDIDEAALGRARLPISAAHFSTVFSAVSRQVGREPADDELEPLTLEALKISRFVTGRDGHRRDAGSSRSHSRYRSAVRRV